MRVILPFNTITEDSIRKVFESVVEEISYNLPVEGFFTIFQSDTDKVYDLVGVPKTTPLEMFQVANYTDLTVDKSKVYNKDLGTLTEILRDDKFSVALATRKQQKVKLTIETYARETTDNVKLMELLVKEYSKPNKAIASIGYDLPDNLVKIVKHLVEVRNINSANTVTLEDLYLAGKVRKNIDTNKFYLPTKLTVNVRPISSSTKNLDSKKLVTISVFELTIPLYDTVVIDLPLQIANTQLDRKLIDFESVLIESESDIPTNLPLAKPLDKFRTYRGISSKNIVTVPQLDPNSKTIKDDKYNTVTSILLTLDKTKPRTLCNLFDLPDFKLLEPYVSYIKATKDELIEGNLFKIEVYDGSVRVDNFTVAANGNLSVPTNLNIESEYRLVIGIYKQVAKLKQEQIEKILEFLKPVADDFVANNKHLDSNLYTYALAESAKGLKYRIDSYGNLITPKGKLSFIDGSAVYELVDELNYSEWYKPRTTTLLENLTTEEDEFKKPTEYYTGTLPTPVGGEWIPYKSLYFHNTIANLDNEPATDYTRAYDAVEADNKVFHSKDFKLYIWDRAKATKSIGFRSKDSKLAEYYKTKYDAGTTDIKADYKWAKVNDIMYLIEEHKLYPIDSPEVNRLKLVNDTTIAVGNGPYAYYHDDTLWLFHTEGGVVSKLVLEHLTEAQANARRFENIARFMPKSRILVTISLYRKKQEDRLLRDRGWYELLHSGLEDYAFNMPEWNDWLDYKIHKSVMDYETPTEFMNNIKTYMDSHNFKFNKANGYDLYCWDNNQFSGVTMPNVTRMDPTDIFKRAKLFEKFTIAAAPSILIDNYVYKIAKVTVGSKAIYSGNTMLNAGIASYYVLPTDSSLFISYNDAGTSAFVTYYTGLEDPLITLELRTVGQVPRKDMGRTFRDLTVKIPVIYTYSNIDILRSGKNAGYHKVYSVSMYKPTADQFNNDTTNPVTEDPIVPIVVVPKPIVKPNKPIKPSEPNKPEADKPKPPATPTPGDTEIWRLLPGRTQDKIWVHRSLINLNDDPVTDDSEAIRAWPTDYGWKWVWETGDEEAFKALPANMSPVPNASMPIVQNLINKANADGELIGIYQTLTKEKLEGLYDYYIIKYNGKYLAVKLVKFEIIEKPIFTTDSYSWCYVASGYVSKVEGNQLSIDVVSLITENQTRFTFEPITDEILANYTVANTSNDALMVLQDPKKAVKVFVWSDLVFTDATPRHAYNIPNAWEVTLPKADNEVWRQDYLSKLGFMVHNQVMNYRDKPKVDLTKGFDTFLASATGKDYSDNRNKTYSIFYLYDESKLEAATRPVFGSVGNSYNVALWLSKFKNRGSNYTHIGNVAEEPIMYFNNIAYKVMEVTTEDDSAYQSILKQAFGITDPNIRVTAARDFVIIHPGLGSNQFFVKMFSYHTGLHPTLEWDNLQNKGRGVVTTFRLKPIPGTDEYLKLTDKPGKIALDYLGKWYSKMSVFDNATSGPGRTAVDSSDNVTERIRYGIFVLKEFLHETQFGDSRPDWIPVEGTTNKWYSKYSTEPYVTAEKSIANKLQVLKDLPCDRNQDMYFFNYDTYDSLTDQQKAIIDAKRTYASNYATQFRDGLANLKDPKNTLIEINGVAYKFRTEPLDEQPFNNPKIEYLYTNLKNIGFASNTNFIVTAGPNKFWYIGRSLFNSETKLFKSHGPTLITLEPYEYHDLVVTADSTEWSKRLTKHMFEGGLDSTVYYRLNYLGYTRATDDIQQQDDNSLTFKPGVHRWGTISRWDKSSSLKPSIATGEDLIRMNYDKWLAHHPLKAGEEIHEVKVAEPIYLRGIDYPYDKTLTMVLTKYTPVVDNVKDTVYKIIVRLYKKYNDETPFYTKEFPMDEVRDVDMTLTFTIEDNLEILSRLGIPDPFYTNNINGKEVKKGSFFARAEVVGHTQSVLSQYSNDPKIYNGKTEYAIYRPIGLGGLSTTGLNTKNPRILQSFRFQSDGYSEHRWLKPEYIKYKVYKKDEPSKILAKGKADYVDNNTWIPIIPNTDDKRYAEETPYVIEVSYKLQGIDTEYTGDTLEFSNPRATVDTPTISVYNVNKVTDKRVDLVLKTSAPSVRNTGDRDPKYKATHWTITDKESGNILYNYEFNARDVNMYYEIPFRGIGSNSDLTQARDNLPWEYGKTYILQAKHIYTEGLESALGTLEYTIDATVPVPVIATPVVIGERSEVKITAERSREFIVFLDTKKFKIVGRESQTLEGTSWTITDTIGGNVVKLYENLEDSANLFSLDFTDVMPESGITQVHNYRVTVRYYITHKGERIYSDPIAYTFTKVNNPFGVPDRKDGIYPTMTIVSKTDTTLTVKINHPGEGPRDGYRFRITGPMYTKEENGVFTGWVTERATAESRSESIKTDTYTFTDLIPNTVYEVSGLVYYAAGVASTGETFGATYTYYSAAEPAVTEIGNRVDLSMSGITLGWDKVTFIDWVGVEPTSFYNGSYVYQLHFELRKDNPTGELVAKKSASDYYAYFKQNLELKTHYALLGWIEFRCAQNSERRAISNAFVKEFDSAKFNKSIIVGEGTDKINYAGYTSFTYYDGENLTGDLKTAKDQHKALYNLVPVNGNACYMFRINVPEKYKQYVKDITWYWKMPWEGSAQPIPKNDPSDIFAECIKIWPWGSATDLTTGETKTVNATSVSLKITFEDDSTQVWSIY